jgi:hypothetical protein
MLIDNGIPDRSWQATQKISLLTMMHLSAVVRVKVNQIH